jgi:hypothetical protein
MKRNNTGLSKAPSFKGAGKLARRQAFRADLPVVILEKGKIYYVYSDGTRKETVSGKNGTKG